MLSVDEALNAVYSELEGFTGWRFLKSQRCLKQKVGDLEFVINFFSSKWNTSGDYVGINADFRIVYKKLGKLPVQNVVASYEYHPKTSDDAYWYDISTEEKLYSVIENLKNEIYETALSLEERMNADYKGALRELFENHFDDYHVKLEFIAVILGVEIIIPKAQSIVDALSDDDKQDILDYKTGKRTKQWMLNPTNLRFVVDSNLIEI